MGSADDKEPRSDGNLDLHLHVFKEPELQVLFGFLPDIYWNEKTFRDSSITNKFSSELT